MEKYDEMKCGMFNNRSYFGYKSSVLKSGICKYYRRELFYKFEWCVVEMMIMGSRNKAVMTNILNRLKILVMEEIVFDEINVMVNCVNLLNMIEGEENWDKRVEYILEFCEVVRGCDRGRLVSYVNCWWKFYGEGEFEKEMSEVEIEKVKKYKKEGDDEELLKMGELLIRYIENRDEKLVKVFGKMFDKEGKFGNRNKKKEGIYLFWEIVEDVMKKEDEEKLKNFMVIYKFGLEMFNRKKMNERRAFGVWIGMIVWKFDEMNWEVNAKKKNWNKESVVEYLRRRSKIVIERILW